MKFITNSSGTKAIGVSKDVNVVLRIAETTGGLALSVRSSWICIDDFETGTLEQLQAKALEIIAILEAE